MFETMFGFLIHVLEFLCAYSDFLLAGVWVGVAFAIAYRQMHEYWKTDAEELRRIYPKADKDEIREKMSEYSDSFPKRERFKYTFTRSVFWPFFFFWKVGRWLGRVAAYPFLYMADLVRENAIDLPESKGVRVSISPGARLMRKSPVLKCRKCGHTVGALDAHQCIRGSTKNPCVMRCHKCWTHVPPASHHTCDPERDFRTLV